MRAPGRHRPRRLLIDLFGTLVAIDWAARDQGRASLARKAGVPLDDLLGALAATRERRDRGQLGPLQRELQCVLQACGRNTTVAECEELAVMEQELWTRSVSLFPDTVPALLSWRDAGHALAIVSNCNSWTRSIVNTLGLPALVDDVVLSCEVGAAKPDRAIFEIALQRLNANPSAAVFVDDSVEYLDGAVALGIETVLIDRTGAAAGHCHRRVTSLAEVARFL